MVSLCDWVKKFGELCSATEVLEQFSVFNALSDLFKGRFERFNTRKLLDLGYRLYNDFADLLLRAWNRLAKTRLGPIYNTSNSIKCRLNNRLYFTGYFSDRCSELLACDFNFVAEVINLSDFTELSQTRFW